MHEASPRHNLLARQIRGAVVEPGNSCYDGSREIWNARFDRRPAAIVFVEGPDDVAATLDYAASRGLPIAVRAGGHSPAGWSSLDDGIVIDLRRLDEILVAEDGEVTVGGGAIVADLIRRLNADDLVLPVGTCPGVGIAGLALGGGLGHLNGCIGLTCDVLRWAEIVLADGSRRIASKESEPELFWALRGAGANFGIVTRMGFRSIRQTEGYGGAVGYRGRSVRDVVRAFRDVCLRESDDLGLELRLLDHGAGTACMIAGFWAGEPRDGPAALRGLQQLGDPDVGRFGPVRYATLASFDEGMVPRRANYQRSANLGLPEEDVISSIFDAYGAAGEGAFMTLIHWRHGAAARTPAGETAYPHRSAAFETTFAVAWTPGREGSGMRQRVDAAWSAVGGESLPVYVNMLDEEPAFRLASAYGVNYRRLSRLKARHDPENRLRSNANIQPNLHPTEREVRDSSKHR